LADKKGRKGKGRIILKKISTVRNSVSPLSLLDFVLDN
jgi:hypothetical protein